MNVGKYYVAGIPFDSENSLKHYGVKGMEWNKHKFGIDADDRYIKWLKNAGQNIGKFATNTAQNVAKGATAAAKTVGSAVNKGANFVGSTANQAGKWAGQQAQNTGKTVSNAANQASKWAGQQARNVGNTVSQAAQGVKDYVDYNITGKGYDRDLNAIKKDIAANPNSFGYNGGTGYVSKTSGDVYVPKNSQDAKEYFEREASKGKANSLFGRVENATQGVGNAMSGAAKNVGNTVGQAAQNVSNWYTGQPNADRAEAIDRQVQEYERMGEKMYENGLDNEGARYHKLAENLGRVADANQAKYDNAPRQRITGAAQNVGDWAKGAAQKAADVALWPATREGVANAAQNIGNAVGQAAQNVGEFITGRNANENLEHLYAENIANGGNGMSPELDEARAQYNRTLPGMVEWAQDNLRENVGYEVEDAARNAGNWIGDQAKNVGQAARNVGNAVSGAANKATEGVKGFLNSAGQWVSGAANNVKNTASKAASDAKKGASGFLNSAGQWVSNAAGNVKNAAQNVGNTVGQAAQNVGDWAGNAAKDVGNAVSGAANAVGDWAGQTAKDVGGAVQNAGQSVANIPQNIANWYTGNDAREEAQRQRELGRLNQQYGNALMDAARNGNWNSEENQLGAWDEGIRNYLEGGGQLRAADQYMDMYNNAPRQRITSGIQNAANAVGQAAQNVGGAVSGAANAVGDWVGDRARDVGGAVTGAAQNVGDWAGNAAKDVGNWAGQAAQNVGNFVSEIANPHYQLNTQQMVDNYRQYLNDHPENPQSPRHAEWVQQQQTQLRNDPELRAYYEQNIREQTIPEQTIPEQLIREKLYHSALNEKPYGVSDAFWEKFTADGGTREEYDRDWR